MESKKTAGGHEMLIPSFTWTSVNVGIFRTIDDLEYALSRLPIGRTWDKSLAFTIQPFKTLDLVTIRPRLYEKQKAKMSRLEICQLGVRLGLEECPQEVGPQLLIQGKAERNIEEVLIASTEPMGGRKDVGLTISQRFGPFWLNSYVDPEEGWNTDTVWVFVKPRG